MPVRLAPDHPMFNARGWVNAEGLAAHDLVAVLRRLAPGESEDLGPVEVDGEALGESLTKVYAIVEAGCRAPRGPGERPMRRGARARAGPRLHSPRLPAPAAAPGGWVP